MGGQRMEEVGRYAYRSDGLGETDTMKGKGGR